MKKVLLIALAAAVLFCLPLTAQAKTEFELGGYIRLDAVWNSQQGLGHTLSAYSLRDNFNAANHGRFQMNANATRFNFTIKGPELWGGKVTGFIEADFDGAAVTTVANGVATSSGSFNQAVFRLRHAMFKINWPDREILFGQYWSVLSEMIPETADSGAYCLYGATQLRLPQVRYTQKFSDEFNASLEVASPQNGRWGLNLDANNQAEGELSETPMVEAKVRYEQDLYGKAAFYGKPRAFYVGLGAGWFRSQNVGNQAFAIGTWRTLGPNNFFLPAFAINTFNHKYHEHWLFLVENFTPIIPTVSKSLAGTMGLAHQWWIGQGVSAWRLSLPQNDRYFVFSGFAPGAVRAYDYQFLKMYGGNAQLQYYWTNEIFTNLNFGFEKSFGFNPGTDPFLVLATNPKGSRFASPLGFDPISSVWRAGVTQWYRPVSAVKFALQYTYSRTNYLQSATVNTEVSRYGDCHTLFANAWYMF
jgi:hypothetical protein